MLWAGFISYTPNKNAASLFFFILVAKLLIKNTHTNIIKYNGHKITVITLWFLQSGRNQTAITHWAKYNGLKITVVTQWFLQSGRNPTAITHWLKYNGLKITVITLWFLQSGRNPTAITKWSQCNHYDFLKADVTQ